MARFKGKNVMDMQSYIAKRLDSMKSITEKDMLRDVMEDIFIPMYNHVGSEYARLESRVREQMPMPTGLFVIWNTILERENAMGNCPYLFPMLEEDLTPPEILVSDISDRLKNEREIRLDTVYIGADYLVCKQIQDSKEIFSGTLTTESGDFNIGVKLRLSVRYQSCIQMLYKLFISNNVPWQTINSPYLFKMFDVMLVRIDSNEKAKTGSVIGYNAAYGSNGKFIKQGLIPMWNIENKRIKSEDFPLAALDKVNYEYVFDLDNEGVEHGYLADYDSADISAVRREQSSLIVTSPTQKGLVWDMHKVVKRKDYATEYFQYELMNNSQEDSFAARMTAYYGTVIKTYAELHRLLAAYDVSGYIELESVQVVSGAISGETYEVNSFLKDEVRDLAVSKSLLLKFKQLKRGSYLLRDIMSFLVSQVQLVYPEFNCVGVLI